MSVILLQLSDIGEREICPLAFFCHLSYVQSYWTAAAATTGEVGRWGYCDQGKLGKVTRRKCPQNARKRDREKREKKEKEIEKERRRRRRRKRESEKKRWRKRDRERRRREREREKERERETEGEKERERERKREREKDKMSTKCQHCILPSFPLSKLCFNYWTCEENSNYNY
jgi:Skp family chaperone for outer membrane proteins